MHRLDRNIHLLTSAPGPGKASRLIKGLEVQNAITSTTKGAITMNYEGVPTAARNVVHADDFKIAVPLSLELVHLRAIAVVA